MAFDWHSEPITRQTLLDAHYRITQNVRRFMTQHCGEGFHFDRAFMAWVRSGAPADMGAVVDEWKHRAMDHRKA